MNMTKIAQGILHILKTLGNIEIVISRLSHTTTISLFCGGGGGI